MRIGANVVTAQKPFQKILNDNVFELNAVDRPGHVEDFVVSSFLTETGRSELSTLVDSKKSTSNILAVKLNE